MIAKVNDKFYSRLFKLCITILIGSVFLKLFGSTIFTHDIFSATSEYNGIRISVMAILYVINSWFMVCIVAKKILSLNQIFILIITGLLMNMFVNSPDIIMLKPLIEFLYLIMFAWFITKQKMVSIVLESLFVVVIVMLFQMCSLYIRDIDIVINADSNLLALLLLSIDYYILLLLLLLLNLKKRGFLHVRFMVFLSKKRGFSKRIQQVKTKQIIEGIEDGDIRLFVLFTIVLTVFQLLLTFSVCYFIHDTLLNTIIIMISFFVMRAYFGKSYHSNSIITCTFMTIFSFYAATTASLPLYMSVLFSVCVGAMLAYIMHRMYISSNE